ncbi:MAG TPA: hypothetical protein VJI75_03805 [Candidatus Nanoarchaeia archaeon]|nr:hypothetical protein [Candidatus Nanoarchaeia archaeon]
MCEKCMKIGGIVMGLAGIALLLQDLGRWDIWGLNWYTLAFLIAAFSCLGTSACKDCRAVRNCKK